MTLIKGGYFNKNPLEIYNAPVEMVIDMYHLEIFFSEYESTAYELNKEGK